MKPPAIITNAFPGADEGKFDCEGDACWFVEYDMGDIVGVVAAEERGPGVWYFFGGAVNPQYRQQGIWRKLHKERTEYCIDHGAKVLLAVSSPGNRKAFEAEAWTQMTHYPYDEDFDEIVYFRTIT